MTVNPKGIVWDHPGSPFPLHDYRHLKLMLLSTGVLGRTHVWRRGCCPRVWLPTLSQDGRLPRPHEGARQRTGQRLWRQWTRGCHRSRAVVEMIAWQSPSFVYSLFKCLSVHVKILFLSVENSFSTLIITHGKCQLEVSLVQEKYSHLNNWIHMCLSVQRKLEAFQTRQHVCYR